MRAIVLAAPAAALIMVVTATSAQAHASVIRIGENFVSVASNHRLTSVCDNEADDYHTVGHYRLTDGTYRTVFDTTTNGDCQEASYQRGISRFSVCVFNRLEGQICSEWRNA
jgi:hypothetical protein